jgi:putative tricarboxylic transport membrane protein
MDIFEGLLFGFKNVLQPDILFYCFVGVVIGTLVGVLPGIGPIGSMSILLPATFGISPTAAIIMLAGIYYGAMYGGSTTSILVNIPGEAASVITCLDGYQMARKGRAGPALGISAMGSFIGGTLSIIALMFVAVPLANAALKFGPPEFFSLMCLSMSLISYLARGSTFNSVLMILVGLILGTVGMDPITGFPRFYFGSTTLLDGIGLIPVAMGLFGISEILMNIELKERTILETKIKNIFPTLQDWKRSIGPIFRGSILGFFFGLLPGGGAVIPTFISYTAEKRLSKNPEDFGKGAIQGVAGPETANNAGSTGAFVPMLALGIPPNPVLAILLGALMIHGVVAGPLLMQKHPEIFWGVIASMYVGNIMLLILNLPMIGLWVKVLRIPYRMLMPLILLFCFVGCYAINNNPSEIVIMIIFGLIGYILRRFGYEPAPLLIAMILGPLMETNFRNSLIISDGSLKIFITRPISATLLIAAALLFTTSCLSVYKKTKERIKEETTGDEED